MTANRGDQHAAMPFADKRIVIMGLGRFGGGVGAARFCASRGASVLVTDTADREQLRPSLDQLSDLPIEYRLGEHREDDFVNSDLLVVNPAVRPGNRFVAAARAAGVAVSSEITLLATNLPSRGRTIGVTGTAGKSTVVAMIGHILRKRYGTQRVHVGGNIGGSLLDKLDQIAPDDWVVLELSSFMLVALRQQQWSPHIAVVTNIMPNHLDWHRSFEDYVTAKQTILQYQDEDDIAVLGGTVEHWPTRARRCPIRDMPGDTPLLLPGEHNRLNAAMALSVCTQVLPDEPKLAQALADFVGLPHRLQFIAEHNGVRYYNDSKSTTPEAAMLAIESFEPGSVHVILGGCDKGADLKPLAQHAAARCRAIYTIGATGSAIADAAGGAGDDKVVRCDTLDRAVAELAKRVRSGDVVLLSPGCASLDQFQNYEQRGVAFTQLIEKQQRSPRATQ